MLAYIESQCGLHNKALASLMVIYYLLLWPFLRKRKVLDCGCGAGVVGNMLGNDCVSMDIADNRIYSSMPFVLASAETIPIQDSTFDVVVSSHVLEHCEYPARAITEMIRLLRPKGKLFIVVPSGIGWKLVGLFRVSTEVGRHIDFKIDDYLHLVKVKFSLPILPGFFKMFICSEGI